MSRSQDDGPSESTVVFRKRAGMILCFGVGVYLFAVALGLLRHAGGVADLARSYAQAPYCSQSTTGSDCRRLVPVTVRGTRVVGGEVYYRLQPQGRAAVDFH